FERPENVLSFWSHTIWGIDNCRNLPQGIILGVTGEAAGRFAKEVHYIQRGLVIEVPVSVRAGGQENLETRSRHGIARRLQAPLKQRTPPQLDPLLQARILVCLAVRLEAGFGV